LEESTEIFNVPERKCDGMIKAKGCADSRPPREYTSKDKYPLRQ